MSENAKVMQCPSCGGSSSSKSVQCDYCGNYLLHLTALERRSHSVEGSGYFRSLKRLYQFALVAGLIMMVVIYFVLFNSLSEDELVLISPIWFLLTIFGTAGIYSEKAVTAILRKQAPNFAEALVTAVKSLSPILMVAVFIVFLLPAMILRLSKRFSSPLLISILVTLTWAIALYIFLVGIFPSM